MPPEDYKDTSELLSDQEVDENELFELVPVAGDAATSLDESEAITEHQMLSLPLDELLCTPVYNFRHETAFREIERLGRIFGIDSMYLHNCFRSWLYEDRRDTPTRFQIGQSPDVIWRQVPAVKGEWREFAQIALRLVTIGTSEADCERALSRQRDVQGLHTNNIRTDLLEARMRS